MLTDDQIHEAALRAGAMVLGDQGTRQQYLIDLDQLRRLLAPPCPVLLPVAQNDSDD
ncbi:hypothetical protein ACQR1I_36195 [Bradyrhizobium sp. HKCCYLS2038]|uniref:hypothetical protein n=1 Tax=Bradyrhizobium sp. HKCCYLS2038 TaxID=3420764 RepID=UPI003EBA3C70